MGTSRIFNFLIAAGLACAAGAAGLEPAEHEKPRRTPISDIPWQPKPAPVAPKVIYGTDDRIDLYEEIDPDRRAWAASTCGLFSASSLAQNGNGTFTIGTSAYDVCPDEPYANQPTAAFCSGFMVGDDIIATAGHCFDSGDLNSTRFVFGFAMQDANTPVLTVDADQVYTGIEILGRALQGDLDYAVIRVDRDITAPGAEPFPIRRAGMVANGSNVGVIGHPSGLPLKLAFGDNTVVRDNSNSGYFTANLDTYGGNSGSPVIDPSTGIIEGILVRGEQDFIQDGNCLRSNVLSNTGGGGEDVSKASTFLEFIPELINSNGDLALDRMFYSCDDEILVTLADIDIAGMGSIVLDVATSRDDMESVMLLETAMLGEFEGTITIGGGEIATGNGTLEVVEGDTVAVTYLDIQHGPSAPDEVIFAATIDCTAPVVSGVTVTLIGAQIATVNFTTNESTSGQIVVGESCGAESLFASFADGTNHSVLLQGLLPLTEYFFSIELADEAGNSTVADNAGACFAFGTAETTDYYTQEFGNSVPDLNASSVLFTPTEGGGYTICRNSITALPSSPAGGTQLSLADDGSQQVVLGEMALFTFFGTAYDQFFVNANGNITFGTSDGTYDPDIPIHFSTPRIAACFTDLDPESGGGVSYRQFGDRIAVTWSNVPHFTFGGSNTFQAELFFDGAIRLSYLSLTGRPSIVGLSAGAGVGSDFDSTDLSAQATCDVVASEFHSADIDRDLLISLQELLRVVQFLNLAGYHCDATGEDGYNPGPGGQSCAPHDSDYNPQDWEVSLSELLRLVQFFNAIGYEYDSEAGTEDGFVPIVNP